MGTFWILDFVNGLKFKQLEPLNMIKSPTVRLISLCQCWQQTQIVNSAWEIYYFHLCKYTLHSKVMGVKGFTLCYPLIQNTWQNQPSPTVIDIIQLVLFFSSAASSKFYKVHFINERVAKGKAFDPYDFTPQRHKSVETKVLSTCVCQGQCHNDRSSLASILFFLSLGSTVYTACSAVCSLQ